MMIGVKCIRFHSVNFAQLSNITTKAGQHELASRKDTMTPSTSAQEGYLSWTDVADMFRCGRSKALLIIQTVGPVYIGHAAYVRRSDLEAHIAKHGGVSVSWPRRKARKEGCNGH